MNDQLREKIIGCAFKVYNTLGFGFLESVYEKALSIELSAAGIRHETQAPIKVIYNEQVIGNFTADMLVEGILVVELKSVSELATIHEVQLVNYLTATKIDDGLLINFGPSKVEVRRKFRSYKKNKTTG